MNSSSSHIISTRSASSRIPIGITIGDLNGIGGEIILKSLQDPQNTNILKHSQIFIYGPAQILRDYAQILALDCPDYQVITHIQEAQEAPLYLIDCSHDLPKDLQLQPGLATNISAKAAFHALETVIKDLQAGYLKGLITAPIAKYAMQDIGFSFPGHTEYLAHAFQVPEVLMMMLSEAMRVGLASTHVPLLELKSVLNASIIKKKVALLFQALQKDFGIENPRVALLGLNPHAGEEGRIASEEQQWFKTLIQSYTPALLGPYAADSFFAKEMYRQVDAVLAMYHDQGLIPFKMLSFDTGVNYTAGLPILRVSPDHGTAFDIAGKNQASARSMSEALRVLYTLLVQKKT